MVADTLAEDQALPLDQARERRTSRTSDVTSVAGAVEAATAGNRARIPWAALGADGGREPTGHGAAVGRPVADDGSVPLADDAPGDTAVPSRAYRTPRTHRSGPTGPPHRPSPHFAPNRARRSAVVASSAHLRRYPQISAPARVPVHQLWNSRRTTETDGYVQIIWDAPE